MVQFYGVFLALIKCLILFKDGYYYRLVVFNIRILEIGAVFCERIIANQLQIGVDYNGWSWQLGCGMVRIDTITPIKIQKSEMGVELNSYYSDTVTDSDDFMDHRLSYNMYPVNGDKEDVVINYGMKELNDLRLGETQIKTVSTSNFNENKEAEILVSQKKECKLEELRSVLDSTSSTKLTMNDNEVTHSLTYLLTHSFTNSLTYVQ